MKQESTKSVSRKPTFYQNWSGVILSITLLSIPLVFYSAGKAISSNENRVEDWLPKSFDQTQRLVWFRQHFAADQFVIVSWRGCELGLGADKEDDPRIAKLADYLTPANSSEDGNDSEGALSADELSAQDAALVRKYIKSVETGRSVLDRMMYGSLNLSETDAIQRLQGSMIGPNETQTCLIVTLRSEAISELKEVLGNGRRSVIGADQPPGLIRRLVSKAGVQQDDLHMGGPPVDNCAIDEEGERTLIRLAGYSGLLGIGLAWWSLRSVLLTSIVFLCAVLSGATSLAIVWLTGQNLDAILMSMPSLVYVLAISGAIHLVSYYREAVVSGGFDGAAERAVGLAWKPAFLCSVTTAVGLLSLFVSELVPIKKFGVYSAAGVMALIFIVYAVMPAALQYSGVGKRWARSANRNREHATIASGSDSTRIWRWLAEFTIRHYGWVGAICVLISAGIGSGIFHARSSIDLLKLFDSRARILQDYRWLEEHLGKLIPLEIVLQFPP